jgi:DNA replication protein DnaC
MLNEPTMEKLHSMRLAAMAEAWMDHQKDPDITALSFDERFGLLVDNEFLSRENKRLKRLLGEAKLRLRNACVEDIDYPPKRNLDKKLIRQLASCKWIADHLNVIITGATGTGKSYVACALGNQVCRRGHRTIYRRMPRLLDEVALARADGTYHRLLQRLARCDLLILDDWGLRPLKDNQRHDILEILEDRYDVRSTIVTSQLPKEKWHDHIGDPSVADAILDRLLHNAYTIGLKGPSRRKEKSKKA